MWCGAGGGGAGGGGASAVSAWCGAVPEGRSECGECVAPGLGVRVDRG